MTGIERELRDVAATVSWPPTPDLAGAVGARLAAPERGAQPWWRRRRVVAVALAALVVAAAAAMAVPESRSAVLRWLGIGGVEVVRVDELPRVSQPGPLPGRPLSLAEVRRSVPYDLLSPPARLGPPDEIRLLEDLSVVTFVWRERGEPRLAVTQLPGTTERPLLQKLVGSGTRIEEFVDRGRPAIWLEGEGHDVLVLRPGSGGVYQDRARLAGNTLLVSRGELTLRVEGDLTRAQALEIARGFG